LGSAALTTLFDETVLLFRRLRVVAQPLHGKSELSGGQHELLRALARRGPRSVPQLARDWAVSRQHVQSLVNPLAEAELVEPAANPAHKRSPLIRLTDRGGSYVSEVERREASALSGSGLDIGAEEIERAAVTLRAVRQAFLG
jgi:DNA-binding MarR family transcriptional regulator